MNGIVDVVGISGGKDSTATALLAFEHLETPPRFVFCDTGLEAQVTYEYVEYLSAKLKALTGVGVETVKADFAARMNKKREKLLALGEIDRANALVPTGNPFLDLCIWKGRFPSTKARFCTQELKIEPIKEYLAEIVNEGNDVMSWSGERAEESLARAKKPVKEVLLKTDKGTAYTYRPLLRWKEQDCFNKLKQFGIEPNPLYKEGFNRVGCFPCMMCRKSEIKLISELHPEVFEQLERWEQKVAAASKHQAASFFAWEGDRQTIWDHVEWSKTSRGGKQYQLELDK